MDPPSKTLKLGFDENSKEKIEEVNDCDFVNPIGAFKISGIRLWGKTDKYINGLEIFYDGQSIGPKVGWKGNVALEKKEFIFAENEELIQIFVTYREKSTYQFIEKIFFVAKNLHNNLITKYGFGSENNFNNFPNIIVEGYYIRKIKFGLASHLSYIEGVFIEKSICEKLKKNPKQNLINFEMKLNSNDAENRKKRKQEKELNKKLLKMNKKDDKNQNQNQNQFLHNSMSNSMGPINSFNQGQRQGQYSPNQMEVKNIPSHFVQSNNIPSNFSQGNNMPPNFAQGPNAPNLVTGQNINPNFSQGQNISPNFAQGSNTPNIVLAQNIPPNFSQSNNMPSNFSQGQNVPPNIVQGNNFPSTKLQNINYQNNTLEQNNNFSPPNQNPQLGLHFPGQQIPSQNFHGNNQIGITQMNIQQFQNQINNINPNFDSYFDLSIDPALSQKFSFLIPDQQRMIFKYGLSYLNYPKNNYYVNCQKTKSIGETKEKIDYFDDYQNLLQNLINQGILPRIAKIRILYNKDKVHGIICKYILIGPDQNISIKKIKHLTSYQSPLFLRKTIRLIGNDKITSITAKSSSLGISKLSFQSHYLNEQKDDKDASNSFIQLNTNQILFAFGGCLSDSIFQLFGYYFTI